MIFRFSKIIEKEILKNHFLKFLLTFYPLDVELFLFE